MIRIFTQSVRAIEAKLRVYKEYEKDYCLENILLHHEFDDNEEISKISGKQRFTHLSDVLTNISNIIPLDELPSILRNTADTVFSIENVKGLCRDAKINDDDDDVGNKVTNGKCVCYSILTVKRIKKKIAKKTMEDLTVQFATAVCSEIKQRIKDKSPSIDLNLAGFDIQISDETYGTMQQAILTIITDVILKFVDFILDAIEITFMAIPVLVWTVDVNADGWREKVGYEIYLKVLQKKAEIVPTILEKVRKMCSDTKADLHKRSKKINSTNEDIITVDQPKRMYRFTF